jgi:hypothetical protein
MQCIVHRNGLRLRGCKAKCFNILCHPKVQALELKKNNLKTKQSVGE